MVNREVAPSLVALTLILGAITGGLATQGVIGPLAMLAVIGGLVLVTSGVKLVRMSVIAVFMVIPIQGMLIPVDSPLLSIPTPLGTVTLFDAVLLFSLVCGFVFLIAKRPRIIADKLGVAYSLFLLSLLISFLVGLSQGAPRLFADVRVLLPYLFMFVVQTAVPTEHDRVRLLYLIAFISGAASLLAFGNMGLQFLSTGGWFVRAGSSVYPFPALQLLGVAVALWVLPLVGSNKVLRLSLSLTVASNLMFIVSTLNRTAMLATAIVFALFMLRRSAKEKGRVFILLATTLIVASIATFQLVGSNNISAGSADEIVSRLTFGRDGLAGSADYRAAELSAGLRAFGESVWLGRGLGYELQFSTGSMNVISRFMHNGYLYFTVKGGILAFLALIHLLVTAVYLAWKVGRQLERAEDRQVAGVCFSALMVTALVSLSFSQFSDWYATTIISAVLGILNSLLRGSGEGRLSRRI